jgi:hypothetical protein
LFCLQQTLAVAAADFNRLNRQRRGVRPDQQFPA